MNNRIAGFTKVRMFTETLMGLHQAVLMSGGSLANAVIGKIKQAKYFSGSSSYFRILYPVSC